MMGKKVIFVGGSSFSGSTFLDMMLSSGNAGFSTGEVYALFYPHRPHHINSKCGCGNPACTIWQEIKGKGVVNLYQEIFRKYPEVYYIVDSSKDPIWISERAKFLKEQGVQVQHVLIWKTPLEFALSRSKRGSTEGWKRHWKNYYKLYFSMVDRWVSVKYSDLAIKHGETLERLCKDIGIDYFRGKELYWEYTHHTLFGNTSAKIHLYSKKSDAYDKCKRELREKIDNSIKKIDKHRTIYYGNNIDKKLLKKVSEAAAQDQEIGLIVDLLEATAVGSDRNQNEVLRLHHILHIPSYLRISYKVHRLFKRILSRVYEASKRK